MQVEQHVRAVADHEAVGGNLDARLDTINKKVSVSRNVYYVNSQRYSRPFWYEYGQSGRRNVVIRKYSPPFHALR